MNALDTFLTAEERERLEHNLQRGSHAEFLAELQLGWNLKVNLASARQARLWESAQRLQLAHNPALGEITMAADRQFARLIEIVEGGETLRDPGFEAFVKRKYPVTDIHSENTRTTVLHPGFGA